MHPFPHCVLPLPTDRFIENACAGFMIFHHLRLAIDLFLLSPISKFSDAECLSLCSETHTHCFSAERRQTPKQNSTLSVCEILVCASKWSLVPPNLSRKPCVESTVMGLLSCSDATQTMIHNSELFVFLIC